MLLTVLLWPAFLVLGVPGLVLLALDRSGGADGPAAKPSSNSPTVRQSSAMSWSRDSRWSPSFDQRDPDILARQTLRDALAGPPGHVGVAHAVEQTHRAGQRDASAQQQMPAAVLDQVAV